MPVGGGGGTSYSYRQLEQLWIAAGGSASLAPLMAAIAEAESGGNPAARNGTAQGLWQINGKPFAGNAFDATTNARMAVAKYRASGLSIWQTYTNGSYKKFLQGGPTPKATGSKGVTGPQALLDEAKKFFGTPYLWGGDSPSGFDCSGLIQYSLQQLGVKNVPRTSQEQWKWTQHITKAQLKPGDLVFYAGSDGTAAAPGHVAIYEGGGKIIQALENGTNVGSFSMSSAGTPVGYGRIPGIGKADYTGSVTAAVGPGSGTGGVDWSGWLSSIGGGLADAAKGITSDPLLNPAGAIAGVAGPLAGIATTLYNFEQHVAWFFVPSHWVRIGCGIAGVFFVGAGVWNISRTGRAYSIQNPVAGASVMGVSAPSSFPTLSGGQMAPAIGIAEVTIGAILLFVAFHNLPLTVDSFPALVSHLQNEVQTGGAGG